MLQEVVSIHGPCPDRSSAATFSAKASTTDVELASSGALAGTGAFQKLVDAKKRKGADSSEPPWTEGATLRDRSPATCWLGWASLDTREAVALCSFDELLEKP